MAAAHGAASAHLASDDLAARDALAASLRGAGSAGGGGGGGAGGGGGGGDGSVDGGGGAEAHALRDGLGHVSSLDLEQSEIKAENRSHGWLELLLLAQSDALYASRGSKMTCEHCLLPAPLAAPLAAPFPCITLRRAAPLPHHPCAALAPLPRHFRAKLHTPSARRVGHLPSCVPGSPQPTFAVRGRLTTGGSSYGYVARALSVAPLRRQRVLSRWAELERRGSPFALDVDCPTLRTRARLQVTNEV